MVHRKILGIVAVLSVAVLLPVNAQQPRAVQLVPQTAPEQPPVKVAPCVDQCVGATVHDTQRVTSYKMVWQTETRHRRKVEYKPVRKTCEREERVVVRKPVVETLFRENRIEETTYDEVTEMRDQTYTVRKPVRETQIREQQVTVRQPVTQKLIEVKRTTTYKPVVRTQTRMVPSQAVVSECQTAVDPTQRSGLQRLSSGYYTDPSTGQSVFRRRGLHWVQPTVSVPVATTVPTLVPQQVGQVDYVPEVTEQRKPIEVTRYVEKVETRRVPIEVERLIEQTETRQVPVTVKVPRTNVTIERVPYTRTTYQEEVIVKRIPYTETTYEKVETVETYNVEVPRWIPETREIQVPRTVRHCGPADDCGNPLPEVSPTSPVSISPPVSPPVSPPISPPSSGESPEPGSLEAMFSSGDGTTDSPVPTENFSPLENNSILNNGGLNNTQPKKIEGYPGELELVDPKTLDETSGRSVVEPSQLTIDSPEMQLKSIVPPATDSDASPPSETDGEAPTDGEAAIDQPPVPATGLSPPN